MNTLLIALALVVVVILVWKLWKPLVTPKPKREVPKDKANLYFFHTDWCGHCQKAMPEWEKLESGSKQFGNTEVSFIRVNAEKERETSDLYEITAYPTIKLETPTGLYTYDQGPVTAEKLTHYLSMTFGKES
jgi:thiol-disulfide isomerase/thioredoxin